MKNLKPILQLNRIVILLNLAYDSIILLNCYSHLDINLLHVFKKCTKFQTVEMRKKVSLIKLQLAYSQGNDLT